MTAPLSPLSRALNARPEGVEIVPIESRDQWLAARQSDVTASAAASLLGAHPWQTAFGLHMLKTGQAVEEVVSEPQLYDDRIVFPPAARGIDFEPHVIRHAMAMRPTWEITYPLERYWRMPGARIGCTPDALAVDLARHGFGVIQAKTTSDFLFNKEWTDPDTREVSIPLWIAVQAMVEAKVTGASWAAVAVMMIGLRTETVLIDIPIHAALWQRLQGEVALFWQRVEAGTPPDPDYNRDGDLIRRIYADAGDDVVDVEGDRALRIIGILGRRAMLKAVEKSASDAEKERKALDAELIHAAGNAAGVRLPDGTVVMAKTINRKGFTVQPSSYRQVSVKAPAGFGRSPSPQSIPETF